MGSSNATVMEAPSVVSGGYIPGQKPDVKN